ncbi:ATP-grasp fold amidoligase family protein [Ornithinimicrobium panacihumi]|uniref:ATP-grasp fold amidoligase family protein n=1 Tax=Ornithinimicrobium panacihumi TaxID=2008449 RepID=UPI003F890B7E
MAGLRSRVIAAIPPLAWRDRRLAQRAEQVAELRERVAALEAELASYRGERDGHDLPPSFRRELMAARGSAKALWHTPGARQHPLLQVPYKLRNYRLAASHGVPVPRVLGVWAKTSDIDLDGLPERFVLKSDRGAGSHGVLPLTRVGHDRYRVAGKAGELDAAALRAHLDATDQARGPFFAEELLEQVGQAPGTLPDDVKAYAFYGRIGHVLLRRAGQHGNLATVASRYVDEQGQDLGHDVIPAGTDPGIPLPVSFTEMMDVARHLSRAVALPFIRVDLYDTPDGPVLGELTRTPGGKQLYRADHDRALGEFWADARRRLDVDIQAGRPPFTLHGMHDAPSLYPPGHPSHGEGSGHWAVHREPCGRWCQDQR